MATNVKATSKQGAPAGSASKKGAAGPAMPVDSRMIKQVRDGTFRQAFKSIKKKIAGRRT